MGTFVQVVNSISIDNLKEYGSSPINMKKYGSITAFDALFFTRKMTKKYLLYDFSIQSTGTKNNL